jgi:hypothetical protein
MEITNDTLEKLKKLNDDQLCSAIGVIADALGASPAQKRMFQKNTKAVRRRLSGASQSDLLKQLSRIDPETQRDLLQKLKL